MQEVKENIIPPPEYFYRERTWRYTLAEFILNLFGIDMFEHKQLVIGENGEIETLSLSKYIPENEWCHVAITHEYWVKIEKGEEQKFADIRVWINNEEKMRYIFNPDT